MSIDKIAHIPLREAAQRLAGYKRFRNTHSGGKRELLQLLQSGDITASFNFPSKAGSRFDIPAEFWIKMGSGDFVAQLITSKKQRRHGQILVRPRSFLDLYVAWFGERYFCAEQTDETRTTAHSELRSALLGMSHKVEAFIQENEWTRFVEKSELDQTTHADDALGPPKGRPPLQVWEVIHMELMAEMLARQRRGHHLEAEQSEIAAEALARAQEALKDKNFRWPQVETVAKKISAILKGMGARLPSSQE